jgi:fluoroacetyl-CoA thioesterase
MTTETGVYQESHVVTAADTASAFGPDFPAAASTPFVLGLAEVAAHRSVSATFGEGETSVGTRSVVDHLAPSPVGTELVVKSRLAGRDGRKLEFEIEVYDGSDLVAAIRHHRAIVAVARIEARLAERAGRARAEAERAKSGNDERPGQKEAL